MSDDLPPLVAVRDWPGPRWLHLTVVIVLGLWAIIGLEIAIGFFASERSTIFVAHDSIAWLVFGLAPVVIVLVLVLLGRLRQQRADTLDVRTDGVRLRGDLFGWESIRVRSARASGLFGSSFSVELRLGDSWFLIMPRSGSWTQDSFERFLGELDERGAMVSRS